MIDPIVMGMIYDDHEKCNAFIKMLFDRGVKINCSIEDLSHEDKIQIIAKIFEELTASENVQ